MSMRLTVQYMALLAISFPAAKVTSSKVDQFPKLLKAARGDNVSMFCTFPIFEDAPEVHWWKRNEESFLEPDSRKRVNVKKGSSSFEILNASVTDSGMYYCKVKHQQSSIGDGSGSQLIVCVPPSPLKILSVEGISANSLKLECKTSAFYPNGLTVSWKRDAVQILTGMEIVKTETVDGLYEVSSSLEEAQPVWNKVIYSCLVYHVSLEVPASVSYTINQGAGVNLKLIFGYLAGGILAILLLIIILTRLKLKASAGINRNSVEAAHREEPVSQEPNNEIAAYASLSLRHDNRPSRRRHETEHTVYFQNKQKGGDNKLIYAALQLADSKTTSTSKQKDESSTYAEVNVSKKERS